jgi:hypothetical protein
MLVPDKYSPITSWSTFISGKEICLVEGDMCDDFPGLALTPGNNPELAVRVAHQMREKPDKRVQGLIGVYSGIYIDRYHSSAYIFGDTTGTRPVFWLSDDTRFVVTGNLWAFRGCNGFSRHWDEVSLMEMLTIGFPTGGRTWLAGVRQLQRGRQVCAKADGRTVVRMLVEPVVRQSWSLKRSVQALRDSMDETVSRISRRIESPIGLGLSGGLDSRLLLASLYTQQIYHRNFTFCLREDESDNSIAQATAKTLGEQHHTVLLDSKVALTHRDCRIINEGESPGSPYLLLGAYAQQEVKAIIIGYPGDVYAGANPGLFRPLFLKNRRTLADSVLRVYMTFFDPDQAGKLLAPSYRACWHDVLDEWYGSFDEINQQSIMDVYLDHVTDYRLQRRTRPRIDSIRWFCAPVYPYMDDSLYTTYRSLPLNYLDSERAHISLLSSYNIGLEKLPSAARSFARIPICSEYRYRHLLHLGRITRQRLLTPARQKWQEAISARGFRRTIINPSFAAELRRLEYCPLFNWREIDNLIDLFSRGVFSNRSAMARLVNAAVVHDFLMGSGFSQSEDLQYLDPTRGIKLIRMPVATAT